jgi:hypothetical protein
MTIIRFKIFSVPLPFDYAQGREPVERRLCVRQILACF